MTQEKVSATISGMEEYAELSIEFFGMINKLDISPEDKLNLLIAANKIFNLGIKIAG